MSTRVFDALTNPVVDLDGVMLGAGDHDSEAAGACLMELVSMLAGEPWTAAPRCVSPFIRRFLIGWNDSLSDGPRQALKRYLCPVIGTATTVADEERREWLVRDWLARECAPAWLQIAGLDDAAELLASLPALAPTNSLAARTALNEARSAVVRPAQQVRLDVVARLTADTAWDGARHALRMLDWLGDEEPDRRLLLDVVLLAISAASTQDVANTAASVRASAHRLVERLCDVGRTRARRWEST